MWTDPFCKPAFIVDHVCRNLLNLHRIHKRKLNNMATRSLDDFEGYIRNKVEQDHLTHREISERLEAKFPGVRGFSIRSVGRFCQEKRIHKTSRLSQAEVEQVVAEGVAKVF